MLEFDQFLEALRELTDEQKQSVFAEIRESILIHPLERIYNVRAEVILEAIHRSGDLTQRGIRGLLAELTFVMDVLPKLSDWTSDEIIGDRPYDAIARRGEISVRIQVKMQRSEAGNPMRRASSYVVETQRTRGGINNGLNTRPYRFGEFDLLAVCMRASTGNWHSFMYAAAADLLPDLKDKTIIKTLQFLPAHPDDEALVKTEDLLGEMSHSHQIWTSDLHAILNKF